MSLLTISEATRELRVSRSSLYRLLGRSDGPRALKIGGRTLIPADALEDWLSKRPSPFESKSDAAV